MFLLSTVYKKTFGDEYVHVSAKIGLISRNIRVIGDIQSRDTAIGGRILVSSTHKEGQFVHGKYTTD